MIKQGDAICERADRLQSSGYLAYVKKHPHAQEATLVLAVGLPPIQTEAEELAALGAPKADEAKVGAIVAGVEAAVKSAKADPSEIAKLFTKVDVLAAAYGFKACSDAL